MFRILFVFVATIPLLTQCCQQRRMVDYDPEANWETEMNTGNDKDGHGCIAAAGYQWSNLLEECIRTFEVGQVMTSANAESTSVCYLIQSTERTAVEVFFVDAPNGVILQQTANGWISDDGTLVLSSPKTDYYLLQNSEGHILYQTDDN